MAISFVIKTQLPVSAATVFNAWLNSDDHSDMTGGEAICSRTVGGKFSAWNGYITGRNISLIPGKEIKQSWRTTEFADTDPDSELTLTFTDNALGCMLTLEHSGIPEGQPDYRQGWEEHYFAPMREHFKR